MICTDDADLYETVRMFRSHGMVRELDDREPRKRSIGTLFRSESRFHLRLSAWNVRSTEINAVMGRSQLKRLDENNRQRDRKSSPFPR